MPQDCSGWSGVCGGHLWSRGRTGWVAWTVAAANHRRAGEGTGGQGREQEGRGGNRRAGEGTGGQGREQEGRGGNRRAGEGQEGRGGNRRAGEGTGGQGRQQEGRGGNRRAGEGTGGQGRDRRAGEGTGEEQQTITCIASLVKRHTCDTLTLSILAMGVGCATPILVPLPLAPTMG